MKKKAIAFGAILAACFFVLITGHITAKANTVPNGGEVAPTPVPENTASQQEATTPEHYYYLEDGHRSTETLIVDIDKQVNDKTAVEPTPMPETLTQEILPQGKTEYFDVNGTTWKVTSEWSIEDAPLSDAEKARAAASDYEVKVLTDRRVYAYVGVLTERRVATLDTSYTVWYYNNGKVHLYTRSLTSKLYDTNFSAEITYGSIVNTDGSASYTLGDRFTLTKGDEVNEYNIGFLVTPTTYSFD